MQEKILMNWSGGKDSAFALYHLMQNHAVHIESLFTTLNAANQRISMHGVSLSLLQKQAQALGLPLQVMSLPANQGMEAYELLMEKHLKVFSDKGVKTAAFGDILLEDLKTYREQQLQKAGWKAVFPLWQRNTRELVQDFLELGFKTRICCIDLQKLPSSFLGQDLSKELLQELPAEVDPCGENGEFHTFVYDGPLFKNSLKITNGRKEKHTYAHDGKDYQFEFVDLLPA